MKDWSEIRRYAFNKMIVAGISWDEASALSWKAADEICAAMKEAALPPADVSGGRVPHD